MVCERLCAHCTFAPAGARWHAARAVCRRPPSYPVVLRTVPRLVALLAVLAVSASAQPTFSRPGLIEQIDAVLDDAAFANAEWGAYAVDVESDEVLYARVPYAPLIPASNMKLVTTAAALDVLGPDYRFRTRLYLDGAVEYGTLDGPLVVRGSGDPRFGGRRRHPDLDRAFARWADDLLALGVRNVAGPIVVADDAVDEPDVHFARRLASALRDAGIGLGTDRAESWDGLFQPEYRRMTPASVYESPPLSALVGVTNTDSNNLYAERLLRALAADAFPNRGPVPAHLRERAADTFLDRIGVDSRSVVVADGSGLSRRNRLTPHGITVLLREMWRHPDAATQTAFVRSLPVGGRTGTLERRYAFGDARGNVRAKTGYIRSVRTLSGYVTTSAGRTVAFSLMCNGYTVPTRRVNRAQDAVVELLADYEGQPSDRAARRTRPTRRSVVRGR